MKHENYSLGYDVLKAYAKNLHWLIHRKITVLGLENIPKDTPLIFTPNHQNALMDAMAVLLSSVHQPTWLARADIFKSKFVSKILYFLKMTPVYRIRDGKDSLGKNDEVFELSIRVLKNNKALALFPEAQHTFKRQSATHKKAVPRIAFLAEERENFELGIHIIPIGLYYNHYYHYHRKLMLLYGEPIVLNKYKSLYKENPGAATIALRKEIYEKLVQLTLHIKSKTNYEDYETLREISHNNQVQSASLKVELDQDQQFIGELEKWELENPDEAQALFVETSNYRNDLAKAKLFDRAIATKNQGLKAIINTFICGFTLPLFLYGWLNFFISFYLPTLFVRKKIKDKAFWATVEFVLWMVLVPIISLIQWGIVWGVSGNFLLSIIYLLSLPVFGKIALYLNDFYVRSIQLVKVASGGGRINRIKSLRKSILDRITKIVG